MQKKLKIPEKICKSVLTKVANCDRIYIIKHHTRKGGTHMKHDEILAEVNEMLKSIPRKSAWDYMVGYVDALGRVGAITHDETEELIEKLMDIFYEHGGLLWKKEDK